MRSSREHCSSTPSHIYPRQAQKLRRAFELKGLPGTMVGSVEQFQGQERRVIIISTVSDELTVHVLGTLPAVWHYALCRNAARGGSDSTTVNIQ